MESAYRFALIAPCATPAWVAAIFRRHQTERAEAGEKRVYF